MHELPLGYTVCVDFRLWSSVLVVDDWVIANDIHMWS